MRLAHISDIHVTSPDLGWRGRDWFSKRATGWFNLRVKGREHRFRQALDVLAALHIDLTGPRKPDLLIFSGDATALGFDAECTAAAQALGVHDPAMPPGLAVPGNHDYYTREAAASGSFEKHFGPWLTGERVDQHTYPFARKVGGVWLIGLNSSAGNFWPWDATGCVGPEQRDRLRQLLARLGAGPRILVTHFPVCKADGQPEKSHHLLHDLKEVVDIAGEGKVSLWLHGHRHEPYHVNDPRIAPFPIICVGSSTMLGVACYFEYTIEGSRLEAVRRDFDAANAAFREAERFHLELPHCGT